MSVQNLEIIGEKAALRAIDGPDASVPGKSGKIDWVSIRYPGMTIMQKTLQTEDPI